LCSFELAPGQPKDIKKRVRVVLQPTKPIMMTVHRR
jgi:hypothetical protein